MEGAEEEVQAAVRMDQEEDSFRAELSDLQLWAWVQPLLVCRA